MKMARHIGMDMNLSVITKAQTANGGNLYNVLMGGNSFKAILHRGARAVNPYGDMSITKMFSKPQVAYEDDLNSGSFFSGSKQYHSINMSSYITDFVRDINNNESTRKIQKLMADPFFILILTLQYVTLRWAICS